MHTRWHTTCEWWEQNAILFHIHLHPFVSYATNKNYLYVEYVPIILLFKGPWHKSLQKTSLYYLYVTVQPAFCCVDEALSQLPPGCTPLSDQPLSTTDPGQTWGYNSELQDAAPPYRVGAWAQDRAIPTHHFVNNQATNNMVSIQQFPYVGKLDVTGTNAFCLARLFSPSRMLPKVTSEIINTKLDITLFVCSMWLLLNVHLYKWLPSRKQSTLIAYLQNPVIGNSRNFIIPQEMA